MEQEAASLPIARVLCVMFMCLCAVFFPKCILTCQNNLHDDLLVSLQFISYTPNNQDLQERMRINTSAGYWEFGSDLEKMWQD